jgi:hypothetical protein
MRFRWRRLLRAELAILPLRHIAIFRLRLHFPIFRLWPHIAIWLHRLIPVFLHGSSLLFVNARLRP